MSHTVFIVRWLWKDDSRLIGFSVEAAPPSPDDLATLAGQVEATILFQAKGDTLAAAKAKARWMCEQMRVARREHAWMAARVREYIRGWPVSTPQEHPVSLSWLVSRPNAALTLAG